MTFQFEKLLVYQSSVDFADQVCTVTEHFSRGYGFLVDQLNRAVKKTVPSTLIPRREDLWHCGLRASFCV
ncbi:MAG: four helix bundle protein [Planctomycetaceae bacterium]|nr:four helix bundle protein [Planctomycetaceae bacterium]